MSEDKAVVEEWAEGRIKHAVCRVRMDRMVEFCMGAWEGEGGNERE